MRHTFRQAFSSGKFVTGFVILMGLLLLVILYPLIFRAPPLQIIAQGTFFPPGIYVSAYDSINAPTTYTLNLDGAAAKRVAAKLKDEDRVAMKEWLVVAGVPEDQIDISDAQKLLTLWAENYDPAKQVKGMTLARQRYFQRVNNAIQGLLSTEGAIIAVRQPESGALQEAGAVKQTDYVNISEVPNVRILPLGTDNFGRDVFAQLVRAIGVSLLIGIVAGLIATGIGLVLGLLAGMTSSTSSPISSSSSHRWCCSS